MGGGGGGGGGRGGGRRLLDMGCRFISEGRLLQTQKHKGGIYQTRGVYFTGGVNKITYGYS